MHSWFSINRFCFASSEREQQENQADDGAGRGDTNTPHPPTMSETKGTAFSRRFLPSELNSGSGKSINQH